MQGEELENLPGRDLVVSGPGHAGRQHEGPGKQARGLWGRPLQPCPRESSTLGPAARSTPAPGSHQPPGRQGHTSVRTDDDSGLDTLWLLKKMDLRSEKVNTRRSRLAAQRGDGDTTAQHQGAAPPRPQVTVAASAFRLSVQQLPPEAPVSREPPPQGDTTPRMDTCPLRAAVSNFLPIEK